MDSPRTSITGHKQLTSTRDNFKAKTILLSRQESQAILWVWKLHSSGTCFSIFLANPDSCHQTRDCLPQNHTDMTAKQKQLNVTI